MATTLGTSADGHALPGCRLRRVTEYIQQNLDKDPRLAELAALAYMSPYHFARLFKCSTGAPPHRFTTVFRRVTGITPRGYRTVYLREDRPGRDGG
jgi:AraC-like DNA-binding protein